MTIELMLETMYLWSTALLVLIVSEIMIHDLKKGIQSTQDSQKQTLRGSHSFNLYKRGQYIWRISYISWWVIAGIFFAWTLNITTGSQLTFWIFPFLWMIGDMRAHRPLIGVKQAITHEKWTEKMKNVELYTSATESEYVLFLEIVDNPDHLRKLERIAKHAERVAIYDPKRMRQLFFREAIEPRLREHLRFLMSEESLTLLEIYVILIMLTEISDEVAVIAKDILSSGFVKEFDNVD